VGVLNRVNSFGQFNIDTEYLSRTPQAETGVMSARNQAAIHGAGVRPCRCHHNKAGSSAARWLLYASHHLPTGILSSWVVVVSADCQAAARGKI